MHFVIKEGMSLPTLIKVSNKIKNEKEFEQELDVYVSDESLYYKNSSRFSKLIIMARVALDSDDTAKRIVFAFMNTLLSNQLTLVLHRTVLFSKNK
jgi:hypothetical protein